MTENREHRPTQAYTVPEVMAQLRISRSKVYELMATGELPSIKIGALRRVPAKALDRFIDERLSL